MSELPIHTEAEIDTQNTENIRKLQQAEQLHRAAWSESSFEGEEPVSQEDFDGDEDAEGEYVDDAIANSRDHLLAQLAINKQFNTENMDILHGIASQENSLRDPNPTLPDGQVNLNEVAARLKSGSSVNASPTTTEQPGQSNPVLDALREEFKKQQ